MVGRISLFFLLVYPLCLLCPSNIYTHSMFHALFAHYMTIYILLAGRKITKFNFTVCTT